MGEMTKKATSVIGGLTGIATSSVLTYNTMNDLGKGTIDTNEAMLKLVGGLGGATASGVLLGSAFGPIGMIIGGLSGLVISGISAWIGYSNATRENREEVQKLSNEIDEQTEKIEANKSAYEQATTAIKDSLETKLVDLEYAKTICSSLENLVDVNGKVIKGNEDRVDFILNELSEALGIELVRNGNVITKNGELVGSYNELRDGISEVIQKKKEDAETEAYQELYKESIKERIKAINELESAHQKYGDAVKYYTENRTKESAQALIDAQKNYEELKKVVKETTENGNKYMQKLTEITIDNTNTITNEMIEQGDVTSKYLQNMYKENTKSWEKSFSELEEETKLAMLQQSTTLDNMTPDIINKWENVAIESKDKFTGALSGVEENARGKLLAILTTTNGISPEIVDAWYDLSLNAKTEFIKQISTLPHDTQLELLNTIEEINGTNNIIKMAFYNLSNEGKQEFNRNLNLSESANNRISELTTSIYNRRKDLNWNTGKLAEEASYTFDNKMDGTTSGLNYIQGIIRGVQNNKYLLTNSISGLAIGAKKAFNKALEINSPSRVMEKQAKNIPLGITKGIEEEKDKVFNSMRNLSQEIKINPQDFSINENQFIDYGEIIGNISTQSKVSIEDKSDKIANACYRAFIEAMKAQGISVEIKADKEGIFKTIKSKAEEFALQTGENPFPVLA